MKLVNLTPDSREPRFVNPEQVDAVIADGAETIVYAGQFRYIVRKHYSYVLEMLYPERRKEGMVRRGDLD